MQAVFSKPGVVVVEIKSVYGYETDIFARVADSRLGAYVHIDARKYSEIRAIHRMDVSLVHRVMVSVLWATRAPEDNGTTSCSGSIVRLTEEADDFLIRPIRAEGPLSNMFGPHVTDVSAVCESLLPYARFREKYIQGRKDQYCPLCSLDRPQVHPYGDG